VGVDVEQRGVVTTPPPAFGSLAWAAPRRGRLTFGERLRLVGQGIKVTLTGGRGPKRLTAGDAKLVDEITMPTTDLATWAEATCAACSPPWLVNHCLRTYAYGALLARRDGVACDRELLWTSALLHDLALTDAHRAPPGTCFAYHGATVAQALMRGESIDAARATRVAEAICQHLNIIANGGAEAEARYLQAGAGCDTVAMRAKELERADVDRVEAAHPRLDQKPQIMAVLGERGRVEGGTRTSMLCRLGFLGRVRRAWR
jgi:hypothetical protein